MNFQAQGSYILLEIPYESKFTKGLNGKDIELTSLKTDGVIFTVVSVGDGVHNLKLQDKVMLFTEAGIIITLEGEKYILVQFFDISVRLKRNNETDEYLKDLEERQAKEKKEYWEKDLKNRNALKSIDIDSALKEVREEIK